MSSPDESSPPELAGLHPHDLLRMGLEPSVEPAGVPVDPEATLKLSPSQAASSVHAQPELPLPEQLSSMLPGSAYKVEGFLGQGGMGAVYKGTQVRLKRPVAIKIMRRDLGRDYDFEARFEREAQAMAKLSHPNIVSVIDFGEAGPDYLYIVMELVDGADLMDVIRGGQMTQEMALTLLPQICDALQFAHDHGIVHRDIKPSNIMLTRDGRIKMADFGLAKRLDTESTMHTKTGTGMGTPDYAAPEQFDPNGHIDHRADIYALGVMIYQMITGTLPRGAWKSPSERAAVAPQWDDIVSRAMQSDPADRYQQASEVKTDVTSIPLAKRGADTPARPHSSGGTAAKADEEVKSDHAPGKSRAPLLIGITALAVAALGIFFALRKPEKGRAEALAPAPSPPGPQRQDSKPVSKSSIVATALPESGWQPLFTDAEWRKDHPGKQEFKDGFMHLTKNGQSKTIPWADGAIRARVRYITGEADLPAVSAREVESSKRYKLFLNNDHELCLDAVGDGGRTFNRLASYLLPQPLVVNSTVVLELRVQGDHLLGLLNDVVVIGVHDSRYPNSGKWGVNADNGWFESVEVQPLASPSAEIRQDAARDPAFTAKAPKTSATAGQWQNVRTLPRDKVHFLYGAEFTGEGIRLPAAGSRVGLHFNIRDGAIRARGINHGEKVCLALREDAKLGAYDLGVRPNGTLSLGRTDPASKSRISLREFSLGRPLADGQAYEVELRAVGTTLTVIFDGKVLGTVSDGTLAQGGGVLFLAEASQPATFESFELLLLDPLATSASATKDAPLTNSLGMRFVPVPIKGGPTDGRRVLFSIWETRVQDYVAFANDTKREWKDPSVSSHPPTTPVTQVDITDARAFAAWLTDRERGEGRIGAQDRYRLPRDHEWSCAMGIGDREDPVKTPAELSQLLPDVYPWGTAWPPPSGAGNYAGEEAAVQLPDGKPFSKNQITGYRDPFAIMHAPVGSFAPNALGLHDLGGNVWEWCDDLMTTASQKYVMRGGCYNNADPDALRSACRRSGLLNSVGFSMGFRLVLESASPGLTKNDIVTPAFPAKGAPFTNSLGMKFVPVPGTKVLFSTWTTRVQDYTAYAVANPGIDGSWKTQEKDGVPVGREADHPVVRVTWEDAQTFCAWLTEKETAEGKLTKGAKYRLPTDAEWSAAVGLPPEQGATPQERHFKNEVDFPWGKDWPPKGKVGNYADESFHKKFPKPDVRDPEKTTNAWIAGYDDGYATTSPVGAFPANTQGLYDMGGNVWQWCEDWFDESHKHRVLRGGSWNHDARGNLLSSNRAYAPPASRNLNYGFRCVLAQPAD